MLNTEYDACAPRYVQRVRAILLTENNKLMFIKRVKPHKPPYWVAPGGGMEDEDDSLLDALHRELYEELGATVQVVQEAFVLQHHKAGKDLCEHFYVCRLIEYDLDQRNGPEFNDPTRGEFIPVEIEINEDALHAIEIKTEALLHWLVENQQTLRSLS
jgi:8-oxo-dGTP pyrophosphatase MutT (NUDIX family)